MKNLTKREKEKHALECINWFKINFDLMLIKKKETDFDYAKKYDLYSDLVHEFRGYIHKIYPIDK